MYSKESLKRPTWVIRSRNSKNTFRSVFCLNLDLFVVDSENRGKNYLQGFAFYCSF